MFGWAVIFNQPLPFVDAFAEDLAASLKQLNTGRGLSFAQRTWLKFCLMGVLMTNSVCWASFRTDRAGGLPAIPLTLRLYFFILLIFVLTVSAMEQKTPLRF